MVLMPDKIVNGDRLRFKRFLRKGGSHFIHNDLWDDLIGRPAQLPAAGINRYLFFPSGTGSNIVPAVFAAVRIIRFIAAAAFAVTAVFLFPFILFPPFFLFFLAAAFLLRCLGRLIGGFRFINQRLLGCLAGSFCFGREPCCFRFRCKARGLRFGCEPGRFRFGREAYGFCLRRCLGCL